jgi:hypothetical protein
MTLAEASKRLGQTVSTSYKGASIHWTVKDHKSAYGRDRWLLVPVSGEGEIWVDDGSIHW